MSESGKRCPVRDWFIEFMHYCLDKLSLLMCSYSYSPKRIAQLRSQPSQQGVYREMHIEIDPQKPTALLGLDPLLAIYLSWKRYGSSIWDRSIEPSCVACIISRDLKLIQRHSLSLKAVEDQGLFQHEVGSNPLCVNKILREKKVPLFAGILWNQQGPTVENKVMRPL